METPAFVSRVIFHAGEKHACPAWPTEVRTKITRKFTAALEQIDFNPAPASLDPGLCNAARASACFEKICIEEKIDISTLPGGGKNAVLPSILYATRPTIFVKKKLAPYEPPSSRLENEETVAVMHESGTDKFTLLDRSMDQGGLWAELERMCREKEKTPENLRVLIKPNIAMCVRREDDGVYSDPELMLHLISRLIERGYTRITVGESQNLYGNWYNNREVIRIAAYAGFLPDTGEVLDLSAIKACDEAAGMVYADAQRHAFRLADLSYRHVSEDFGDLGKWDLSEEWVQADFRINFCKAKTHFFSYLTLCTKNLYGALPAQNKMVKYHGKQVTGSLTAEMLSKYPAHFHIVDANTVSDGILGAKMSAISKKPKYIIAGKNLVCVEAVASMLFGINPRASFYFREAHRRFGGLGPIRIAGETRQILEFRNNPSIVILVCEYLEKVVKFANMTGYVFTGQVDRAFPSKAPFLEALAKLLCIFPYPVLALSNWDMIEIYRARIAHRIFCLRHRKNLPLSAKEKKVAKEICHLGPPQLKTLLNLLENGNGSPIRMGSWVSRGSVCLQVIAVTQSASLAITRLLYMVDKNEIDSNDLAGEINALLALYKEGTLTGRAAFFADLNQVG